MSSGSLLRAANVDTTAPTSLGVGKILGCRVTLLDQTMFAPPVFQNYCNCLRICSTYVLNRTMHSTSCTGSKIWIGRTLSLFLGILNVPPPTGSRSNNTITSATKLVISLVAKCLPKMINQPYSQSTSMQIDYPDTMSRHPRRRGTQLDGSSLLT